MIPSTWIWRTLWSENVYSEQWLVKFFLYKTPPFFGKARGDHYTLNYGYGLAIKNPSFASLQEISIIFWYYRIYIFLLKLLRNVILLVHPPWGDFDSDYFRIVNFIADSFSLARLNSLTKFLCMSRTYNFHCCLFMRNFGDVSIWTVDDVSVFAVQVLKIYNLLAHYFQFWFFEVFV